MNNDAELAEFLEKIDLGHLQERFLRNDLTYSILGDLDDDDLTDIGLSLGQRKRVLKASAALRAKASDTGAVDTIEKPRLEARRLTVLFCDMVGSTEMADRLPQDEVFDILQEYHATVRAIARRFGGYVAGLQGDGVVLIFGYPRNFGDIADRAIAAGLALQKAISDRWPHDPEMGEPLVKARVGIAAGRAIVGYDAPVTGDDFQLVGSVVNRAARLQTEAAPGHVLIDQQTRRGARVSYTFSKPRSVMLKGLSEPVDVIDVSEMPKSGDDNPSVPVRNRLLERDAEAAALADAWKDSTAGKAQLVVLMGSAGLGKSSLLEQLESNIRASGARVLPLSCIRLQKNTMLEPLTRALELRVGSKARGSSDSRRKALQDICGHMPEEQITRLAVHLGLEAATPGIAPAAQRALLLEAFCSWMCGADDGATLIAIEDLHWADATTRDLLDTCAARLPGHKAMMVTTTRDMQDPIWSGQENRKVISLAPLESDAADRCLTAFTEAARLPQAVRDRILRRADGNLLMLRELARNAETWRNAENAEDVPVPDSIYDSVSERLDRLKGGREAANALAVFGGGADVQTLAIALDTTPAVLTPVLNALSKQALVTFASRRKMTEEEDHVDQGIGVVTIRHMVLRDVIYDRLIGRDRRKLHARAAAALASVHSEFAEQNPGVLAWHLNEAQDFAAAAPLALSAARSAMDNSAMIEASAHLTQAVEALERLPWSEEVLRMRLAATTLQAGVARSRLGIASDEAGRLSRQVLSLAKEVNDGHAELMALNGLYAHALVGADYVAATDWAGMLSDAATRLNDPVYSMIALRGLGTVALHRGQIDKAVSLLQDALSRYDKERDQAMAFVHGYDHAEICNVFISFGLWMAGDPAGARAASEAAVSHSRDIGHKHSLAQALAFQAMLGALARDSDLAHAGKEAEEMGDRHDLPVMARSGAFFRYATELLNAPQPPSRAALDRLLAMQREFRLVNPFNYHSLQGNLIASVALRLGDAKLASDALDQGEEIEAATGEMWQHVEVMRMRAKIARMDGQIDAATALLQEALTVAKSSGAWGAALRLASEWAEIDPSDETRAHLSEALAQMQSDDGGFDSQRAAKVLAQG